MMSIIHVVQLKENTHNVLMQHSVGLQSHETTSVQVKAGVCLYILCVQM